MRKHSALARAVVLLFSLMFFIGVNCRGQNPQLSEYQVKAAFIYNFARFVEWPSQVFSEASSPMVIGVLGENVFGNDLAQIINGKTIRGHPLEFKEFGSLAAVTNCQVLFISPSEKDRISKILAQLHGASILTVSEPEKVGEADDFIQDGGMINLVLDAENRVRFQINNDAAKEAGLTISSKLLSLAINNQ